MPTRVVTSGIDEIPGKTMFEKRLYFMEHMDHLRQWLMYEPRGHPAMSGAILQKPTRSDADWGVVFIEVSGCLPMCGHGTIGVATVLVEKRLVQVNEPITTVRLDTPAGLVVVDVQVKNGKAEKVTLTNVPRFHIKLTKLLMSLVLEKLNTIWLSVEIFMPSFRSTELELNLNMKMAISFSPLAWR